MFFTVCFCNESSVEIKGDFLFETEQRISATECSG